MLDSDSRLAGAPSPHRNAIYHIWPDFRIKGLINKSISTVKADAAHRSFSALGEHIVWAVIDSGIDGGHSRSKKHANCKFDDTIEAKDFTTIGKKKGNAYRDVYGHGTHVAGIIAGWSEATEEKPIKVTCRHRDERGEVTRDSLKITSPLSGMAPHCKLLSLKVLDDRGDGEVSSVIAALEHIQEINGHGRRIRVHGVNLSVGYDFEPEWFACGQSPLCVEVNRLVKSGVVVVAAAGNSGYGSILPQFAGRVNSAGIELTINDPGNADLAITVGIDAPGHAAHLWRLVFLVEGADRRRPVQAGHRFARREDHFVPVAARDRATERTIQRRKRHQHGGASRLGRDRRVSFDTQRVRRLSGGCETDLPRDGDRLESHAVLSGERVGGPDAGDSVGLAVGWARACERLRNASGDGAR